MKSLDFLEALEKRRSVRPTMFDGVGPSKAQLERILQVAMRVPDHKKLTPWRFIVFCGAARARMGEVMASACAALEETPAPSKARLETERSRFMRAPVVVAVISQIVDKPGVPEWEQILSAGAAGLNLCLAANASGFATCWLTEWVAYNCQVRAALGLSDAERVAGFIYIGHAHERQEDRDRPSLHDKVTYWSDTP